jgi:hypothetical protein
LPILAQLIMVDADSKIIGCELNVMHSSIEITDETYSNLNDDEVENRIRSLGKKLPKLDQKNEIELFKKFLDWMENTMK